MKLFGIDLASSAPLVLGVFFAAAATAQTPDAANFELESPGKKLSVSVDAKDKLSFSVRRGETVLVPKVEVGLQADGAALPPAGVKPTSETRAFSTQYDVPVPVKESTLKEAFSELRLDFSPEFSVVFRAYDDAVAYRFETKMQGDLVVQNENCAVTFPDGAEAWFAFPKDFMNDYQHVYDKLPVKAIGKKMTQLPLLVDVGAGGKVMVTESDLQDYPGMYFVAGEAGALASKFPQAVKSEKQNDPKKRRWDRVFYPNEKFDYIAKTSGTRTFPWRIFATAEKDTDLLNNEIVYKLAEPSRLKDTTWIKPGLVAWDWWNAWNITGVDFKSGPNTDTYKYYIDFAARHGIPYVILDEGWYELGDIMKQVPDIDVPALVAYGKEKGVDLILWAVWRTLDEKMEEALSQFETWGIKGIKIDFMNRDDQGVVNFYWRCAKAAADHKLLVDFHGAHKPAGLQRTYPNVMTFEGFPGGEEVKWTDKTTTPGMTTALPYIRMFTGPLDYTPGAMRNATEKDFKAIFNTPMSMGTRCMQLAMYVIFESPLQMLCDTPTMYEKEKECLDFIVKVPTTWDQTFPLDGKVGEYVVMARRKGTTGKAEFFAGAMTNWTPRDLEIDTSFLLDGEYHAVIFQDGINADMNATDYKRVEQTVKKGDKLKVHLAPGGGWAARFTRK